MNNIRFDRVVQEKVNFLDEVLIKMGKNKLFENPDFLIGDLSWERGLVLHLKKSSDVVEIIFVLTEFGIQIGMDRISEAYEWSAKQIEENKNEVISFIVMILSSDIQIEYCGSNYTKIYFFDSEGKCINTLKYVGGFYIKMGCKIKKFLPVYPIT